MIKQINKNNILVSPFDAEKSWELTNIDNPDCVILEASTSISNTYLFCALDYVDYTTGSPLSNRMCNIALEQQIADKAIYEEGISGSRVFDPSNDTQNLDGTYKSLVYNQIQRSFYNQYNNPLNIFGMENIDFPLSKTNRFLSEQFRVFTIPQQMFGDKIVEHSVELYDNSFDDNVFIYDDGFCNLIAGNNLFSKIQEVRTFGNIINQTGTASYNCLLPILSNGLLYLPYGNTYYELSLNTNNDITYIAISSNPIFPELTGSVIGSNVLLLQSNDGFNYQFFLGSSNGRMVFPSINQSTSSGTPLTSLNLSSSNGFVYNVYLTTSGQIVRLNINQTHI